MLTRLIRRPSTKFPQLLAIALLLATGCTKDDECEDTQCYNGGTVTESCGCDCAPGYSGSDCSTDNNAGIGSNPTCSLTEQSTVWQAPGENIYENEAEKTLPTGYFMTGIGLSVSNDNVVTLMLKGRQLRPDCTWGPQSEYRAGSNANGSLERSFTVPVAGCVITGVQWGVHDNNVSRLVVKYRYLIQQSDGTRRLGDEVTDDSGGTAIEGGLMVTNFSYDPERTVFAGFGAVCYDSNVYQTWAKFRRINP